MAHGRLRSTKLKSIMLELFWTMIVNMEVDCD